MDEIYARDSKRNSQPQNSGVASRNNGERVRCRNLQCRSKLPIPTDNEHKAFCSRYCYNQFYLWKCKVCEEPILKGRRRKSPDHCRKPRCRKDFRRYTETFRYPHSQTCNQGSNSAHFTGAFSGDSSSRAAYFGSSPMADRHWDDSIVLGEHWLFAYGRVVAIVCGIEGDWKIRYPVTFPVQTATTLEAARKLAVNVAFWTWPIGGIKQKPSPREKITEAEWRERDAADEKYVAEDEERLRRLDQADDDCWIDWPPADDVDAA